MQNITILYLKDSHASYTPASDQTRKNRDKINNKIRELGNKYFNVKAIFDQLSLRRDHLYIKGKELVEIYKDLKPGLTIQTQSCRMKEALYCWYAEHFYQEIHEPIFLEFLKKETSTDQTKKTNYIKKKVAKSNISKDKKMENIKINNNFNNIVDNNNPSQKAQNIYQKNTFKDFQEDNYAQIENVSTNSQIPFPQKEEQKQEHNTGEFQKNLGSDSSLLSDHPKNDYDEISTNDENIIQSFFEGFEMPNGDGFNFDINDIFFFNPQ